MSGMTSTVDTGGFGTLGKFEHSTLPLPGHRCFRLLRLQSPANDLEQVRCTLETHSLDACPLYYALSYTWGNPFAQDSFDEAYRRSYPIAINSKTYEVTKNLYEGLLQLRQSHAGSYIWIDAICIWQTNTQERSSQVNLMSEIYGKTAKVIIWLGMSDADTVSVAQLITLLASVPEEITQRVENQVLDVRVKTEEGEHETLESSGLPSYWSPVWLSLVSFFKRSYFQRVWVMQENALAKEAIVYCGAVTFSAQDLWAASTFLVRTNLGGDIRELDLLTNPMDLVFTGMTAFTIHSFQLMCHADSWSTFLDDFRFVNPRGVHPDVTTLLQLFLFQTQGFRATDPRDHVFALLGIIKRVAHIKGLQTLPVRADYTKTAPEIFQRVMKYILDSSGWLDFLAFVPDRSTQSVTDLPSWVPDFSTKAQIPLMWVTNFKDEPRFDAANVLSSTKSDFKVENDQLHLQARYLDVVSDVGEKASDIAKLGVLEEIAKLILKCPANYKTGQDRIEVLWRTLISDQTLVEYPAPAALAQSFSAWVKFTLMKALNSVMMAGQDAGEYIRARLSIEYLAQTDQTGILSGYQQVLDEIVANGDHTAVDGTEAFRTMLQTRLLPYASVFSKVAARRRLFRTESGWLGLGPQSLQAGDSTWVLAAAPTPFALRKTVNRDANAYELVGEAYVHGAMHGEALGPGQPQWDQIVLH